MKPEDRDKTLAELAKGDGSKSKFVESLRFGRYKGVPFTEVPTSYLRWVLSQDFINEDTRLSIEAEYDTRQDRD